MIIRSKKWKRQYTIDRGLKGDLYVDTGSHVDWPTMTPIGKISYDKPELIPKYVRKIIEQMIRNSQHETISSH